MPGYIKKSSSKCEVCQKRIKQRNRRTITAENAQKIADHFGKTVKYGYKQFICTKCRVHLTKGCRQHHHSTTQLPNQSTVNSGSVNISIKRAIKNKKRCFLCKRKPSERCRFKVSFIILIRLTYNQSTRVHIYMYYGMIYSYLYW